MFSRVHLCLHSTFFCTSIQLLLSVNYAICFASLLACISHSARLINYSLKELVSFFFSNTCIGLFPVLMIFAGNKLNIFRLDIFTDFLDCTSGVSAFFKALLTQSAFLSLQHVMSFTFRSRTRPSSIFHIW